jgi:uncharacterized ferritin-like protein (DUF455 family)
LELHDPTQKVAAVQALDAAAGPVDTQARLQPQQVLPGRPARPNLVHPTTLPRRSAHTVAGRAACCTRWRTSSSMPSTWPWTPPGAFPGCHEAYYRDWLRVAAEEAHHFTLLAGHLATWAMPMATSTRTTACGRWPNAPRPTSTARMALVPRTLEARGLDATPPMQARLRKAGDQARGGHPGRDPARRDRPCGGGQPLVPLAVQRDGLDPLAHYALLAGPRAAHRAPCAPPFNRRNAARRAAPRGSARAKIARPRNLWQA